MYKSGHSCCPKSASALDREVFAEHQARLARHRNAIPVRHLPQNLLLRRIQVQQQGKVK